ncbi:MAG: hypothetical protein H6651_13455 [Ardenticatenales bacterium]|nr:hypothetical protein [Ardenticatenales bacterium]
MEDMDHEHSDDEAANRIPNENNATIDPEPGRWRHLCTQRRRFTRSEVAFENFDYGVDGNHWHIYLNDVSLRHGCRLNTSETVRGLEPGEYRLLSVANSDHIEYKTVR